jgi:hypothetical protein
MHGIQARFGPTQSVRLTPMLNSKIRVSSDEQDRPCANSKYKIVHTNNFLRKKRAHFVPSSLLLDQPHRPSSPLFITILLNYPLKFIARWS